MRVASVTATILGLLLSTQVAVAGEPTPAQTEVAPPTSTVDATGTVEPIPPTPGPPTPTPGLPEEGGPPGGVIGGSIIAENVATGEREPSGGTIVIERLDAPAERVVLNVQGGAWQARGLADGTYRVRFEPMTAAEIVEIIPPLEDVQITPIETVRASVRIVEIRNASRVLDVDFIFRFRPIAGAADRVQLPDTGGGSTRGDVAELAALGTLLGTMILLGTVMVLRRR